MVLGKLDSSLQKNGIGILPNTMKVKVKSSSPVWLFAIPWTVAYQAPRPMGFFRQEYWSRLPFPSPGDLPNPGIEPTSPAVAGRFFTTREVFWATREPSSPTYTWLSPCFCVTTSDLPIEKEHHDVFFFTPWFFKGFYSQHSDLGRVRNLAALMMP